MIPFLFVLLPSYLAEFQNSNSHWAWILFPPLLWESLTSPFLSAPYRFLFSEVRDFRPPPSFPVSFTPSCVGVSVHHLFKVVTFLLGSVDSAEQPFFIFCFSLKSRIFLSQRIGIRVYTSRKHSLKKKKISPLLAIQYLKKNFFSHYRIY